MSDLAGYQLLLVGCVFAWSGFVRSGLGFGGSVLSLPFLLLIDDDPLLFLPAIASQLLFFSSLMWVQQWWRGRRVTRTAGMLGPRFRGDDEEAVAPSGNEGGVDWPYLRKALSIMIVPKLVGVAGLLTLPADVMSAIVFVIVSVYAFSYLLDRPLRSANRALDPLFLALGGYMSGTSLIGAPLILSVFASHVPAMKLRDTLFALWFVLVVIKMAAFIAAGVDLQLRQQLWLLPCAAVGHVAGLRFHDYLMHADPRRFYRVLGAVLLLASVAGLLA